MSWTLRSHPHNAKNICNDSAALCPSVSVRARTTTQAINIRSSSSRFFDASTDCTCAVMDVKVPGYVRGFGTGPANELDDDRLYVARSRVIQYEARSRSDA